MSDVRDQLTRLEEPDLGAVDRIWVRYKRTRVHAPRRRVQRTIVTAAVALAATTVGVVWSLQEAAPRALAIESTVSAPQAWSDQVHFEAAGVGQIAGTDRDASIAWESGTLQVDVEPNTGTAVQVVTEEAQVDVIGTVFTVRRDALGTKVGVDRGKVQVACSDGWTGVLTADQTHVCLPITAAGLLGRAEALTDAGADPQTLMNTLDRGVAVSTLGSPVRGELLVRRMRTRATLGLPDDALTDAEQYAASPSGRSAEVQRFAAWLALEHHGCSTAMPWLEPLHAAGSVEETVLLAECVSADDPERAKALLMGVLPTLDDTWRDRAVRDLMMMEAP